MRQSLREAYSSFYSVRDSKSASPTSGRIHKQRESFGPTVCLISKNGESEISDVSEDKMRILMLILEIERLNKVVGLLSQANRNQNKSVVEESEVEYLKKQIVSLKAGFERSQGDKFGQIQRQSKVIHSQNARLAEYEAHINQNNRNLREFENSQSELRDQIKYLQAQLQRTRIDASKIQRDSMMKSQTEIQKSLARERSSAQMQLWKQKLSKYQNLINEQKSYINDQKRTIDKLTNTELEIRQRYDYEVSMLKKGNQDMEQRVQQMERETSNRMLNTSAEASKQLSHKQREMERLRQRNEQFSRQIEQLKRNLETVTRSKNESTEQMRRVITELRQSLEQLNIDYNNQVQRQQQMKSQNGILKKQVQFLSSQLQAMKRSLSSKIQNLNEQLQNKENKINKMLKNKRGYDSLDNKLRRSSYSETNIKLGKNMKQPLLDLQEIIKDVVQLQDSNFRINRLIENNSRKQTHQVYNYASYGL